MKKYLFALAALVLCGTAAFALTDRKISVSELPAAARTFLNAHYSGVEVVYVEVDEDAIKTEYEVLLKDGTKIEFDASGEWKEIDGRHKSLPAAVVPRQIAQYVAANYAGEKITDIERGRTKTEVKLTNGLELKFDENYRMVKIDR